MLHRVRFVVVAAAGAALVVAGCSSSGHDAAASKTISVQAKAAPVVTTTTEPTAIGLRTNADEQAEFGPDKPLTHAQRDKLAQELVVARAAAMKYPTVADATKAGFVLAGEFTPGAGAHYVDMANAANSFLGHGGTTINAATPLAYIYEGTAPTSHITGLMYASFTVLPPDGFTGPNDHWHRHTNLCIVYQKDGKITIPFPPDENVQKSACDPLHGQFMRKTMWMLHAWVVPGWESPQGVFSHANIDLHCADGTDHTDETGFCTGAS